MLLNVWRNFVRQLPFGQKRRPILSKRQTTFSTQSEQLEIRTMLSATLPGITVGRTLSAYTTSGLQNNQVQITYTVYNDQEQDVSGVLLTDTLKTGVRFETATSVADQSGKDLTWSLGTIPAFARASVTLTVSLTSASVLELDTGAQAFGVVNAGVVSDDAPSAVLRQGVVDPNLLAATPDANSNDPFIQEEAARLDYDPQRIFAFLHNEIRYNSYTGSVRGARGTLWGNAGNSLDVASLGVALMRASGIPSQYAAGELSDNLAQQLIVSMFPDQYRMAGIIPPGLVTGDPEHAPELLAETRDHFWLQFDTGNGLKDADPLFAGAQIDQSFTSVTAQFAEVPDELREKTTVTLKAELYSQASALFGISDGLSQTEVLSETFNDVDLVGRPLTIGNFVSSSSSGAVTITVKTNTYSPYLAIGDVAFDSMHDQVIRGLDYQEVMTNFPLSTKILTGLFVDITQSGPAADSQTYSRSLFDRIGYAPRQGLETTSISVDPNGAPALTSFDVYTLNILASSNNPAPPGVLAAQIQQDLAALPLDLMSPEAIATSEPFVRDLDISVTRLLATQYLSQSDAHSEQTALASGVLAYYDRPRIVLTTSRTTTDPAQQTHGFTFSIDLIRESMRILPPPGQPALSAVFFNVVRGIYNNITERNVIAALTPDGQTQSVQNTFDVFQAAVAQGIGFTAITEDSLADLQALNISAEAKARITADVQNGFNVMVPNQNVLIDGVLTIAWVEIDQNTGEFIGVTHDGGHEGLLEFFALGEENFEVQKALNEDLGGILQGFFVGSVLSLKFYFSWGIAGNGNAVARTLIKDKADAKEFVESLDKSEIFDSLLPSHPVIELVLDLAQNGLGKVVKDKVDSEIKKLFRIGFEEMLKNTVKGLTGQDPPINPFLSNLQPSIYLPANVSTNSVTPTASFIAGTVQATVQTANLVTEGTIAATWDSASTSSLNVDSLTASLASVVDADGVSFGSGNIVLGLSTPLAAAVSGNNHYGVNGVGSLSFYGAAASSLGVSGDWNNYTATVSATTGLVTVTLTTDRLKLNGQTLPAGTYTITATMATLAGSGASTSPTFAGVASLNVTAGRVILGPSTGNATLGGQALGITTGVTFANYTGSVAVAGGSSNLDSVSLNGSATDILSISPSSAALNANQNAPATFQINAATTFAGSYDIQVHGPIGWSVSVDSTGMVTATPAPGAQAGTFPIQVTVQSTAKPDLVAQCIVNVTVTATQPGVSLNVTPDPIFTVLFRGAEIPTTFQASIHNSGPTAQTFNLTFPTLPTGFVIQNSVTSVTVPAGQTGIVGIYLQPSGTLLAPGALISFQVTATSNSDVNVTATQTVSFNMPAIHSIIATANPTDLSTIPNANVSTLLTLTNSGNVLEHISLSSVLPNGLTLTGLPTMVDLAPGGVKLLTATLKPASGTPLNSRLTTTVNLNYGVAGSLITQPIDLPVNVVVPGATSIARAAYTANQIGNVELANRLSQLTTALGNVITDPTNAIAMSQALANIDAILNVLSADAFLFPLVGGFTSARNKLDAATTATDLQTAVNALGTSLDNLAFSLSEEAAHGFTLQLAPDSAVALPGVPTSFGLGLQNVGSQVTTYNLAIQQGLGAGITGAFKRNGATITSITLQPGEIVSGGANGVTLELTQTGSNLIPTTFTIRVVAVGASTVALNAQGTLTVRDEFVGVTRVIPSLAFTNAGTPVNVSAQVLNAVNTQQNARVFFTVTGPGNTILFTAPSVPVALTVQTSLVTVDLGSFSTTGFADGTYTIDVIVTDPSGSSLAGGTGKATVLVGIPMSGELTVSPALLQPTSGGATVTNTLSLQSQIALPDPLTLIGQVQTLPIGTSVALNGTIGYVVGTNDIEVIDVTNPTSPQVLHTLGQADIVQNGFTVIRTSTIGGQNYLLVGTTVTLNSTQFKLLVYSLTDPQNPALVSSTPFLYRFMSEMLVSGTTLLVSTHGYDFSNLGGGIFDQFGTVLSIDISNPASPTLKDVLFKNPNRLASEAGDTNQPGGTVVNDHIAYIASTTSVGANTQVGSGRVLVLETSDPADLQVLREVIIPKTVQVVNVAVQGNIALVVGSTGGWRSPLSATTAGLTGTMTMTLLNISDPENPILIGSTFVTNVNFSMGVPVNKVAVLPIGQGRFAVSDGLVDGDPVLLLIDTTDPAHLALSAHPVPSLGSDMAVAGNLLYTTSASGLLVYDIGPTSSIPFTASVEIPTGTGVAIVPGSFNFPPTQTIVTANSTKLIWSESLAFGETAPLFTWRSTVTGLAAGEIVPVTLGASVDFTSDGTAGSFTLAPTVVTGAQLLGLTPDTQTVEPGSTATYTVTVFNQSDFNASYGLTLRGLPANWTSLPTAVNVPAHGSNTVTLTIATDSFSMPGDYAFSVQMTGPAGAKGVVYGHVTVEGQPPAIDASSHGILVSVTPASTTLGIEGVATFQVQLVNTGSAVDTYGLIAHGLPPGVLAIFSQSTIVVPPGLTNVRNVTVTLTSSAGTQPGSYPFIIEAVADLLDPIVSSTGAGTLVVVANGVQVTLDTANGNPGDTFLMTVTNTGSVPDTYDLSVAGPAAVVASLGITSVTLAPGASQVIAITTGPITFAAPGSLSLTANAVSRGNPQVTSQATAAIEISETSGLDVDFTSEVQLLPIPGTADFLLVIKNTGNLEDAYSATITGTTGPITASLSDLNGLPTQLIPIFRLPGLFSSALLLRTTLTAAGQATVTVEVASLNHPEMTATSTAKVRSNALPIPTVNVTGGTFTFNGQTHAATGSVVGNEQPLGTPVFTYVDANNVTSSIAPVNAGTYTVTASFAGNENFGPASSTAILVINRATPVVSVTGGTFLFDGLSHPAAGSVTGINNENLVTPTFTYTVSGVTSSNPPVDAGVYTIAASFEGNTNYLPALSTATITVTAAGDNSKPTDITLSNHSIAENQPAGTIVGTLSTTDPDAANTFTYELVSGAGVDDNESFDINSNGQLVTTVGFNFETRDALAIKIRSTDQGGLSFEKQFTLNVTNVDEPPEIVLTPGVRMLKVPVKKIAFDPQAKIRDVDTPIINLANCTVQVKVIEHQAKGDKVRLLKAKGADLTIKGKHILYQGKLIGERIYGKKGGVPLTVKFNHDATQAGVEAVLDKIYYRTKGTVGSTRTLEFSLTGLANGQSSKTTKIIQLQ